jgi:hypothetical protein
VVTKGRRFRARRGGRRRCRDHCCALDRPNPSPPLAPGRKSWFCIFCEFSDFTFLPTRRRDHLEPYNILCSTCPGCPQGARSEVDPGKCFFKLLYIYFQFPCHPPWGSRPSSKAVSSLSEPRTRPSCSSGGVVEGAHSSVPIAANFSTA